jgi:hypothetical protein
MPSYSHRRALSSWSPRCHALLLLWAWVTLILAPAGATLHAMSHIGHGAAPQHIVAAHTAPHTDDHDATGALAHCHTCDEWQLLDHALAPTPIVALARPVFIAAAVPAPHTAATARGPWILPRAPPARARVA